MSKNQRTVIWLMTLASLSIPATVMWLTIESSELLVSYSVFFLAIGITFFPRFVLRNYRKVTSQKINSVNPKFRGLRLNYRLLSITIVIPATILLLTLFRPNQGALSRQDYLLHGSLIFTSMLAFLSLYDGLFALVTDTFPMINKLNWNSFVYDGKRRFRWLSMAQITLAVMLLIYSCVMLTLQQ
jgi:hypothetical protein